MADGSEVPAGPRIVIRKNGPYRVYGDVPLVAKTQIVSESGEPLAWRKDGAIDTASHYKEGRYALCRCGASRDKPFCDSAHKQSGFDGAETADPRPTVERQLTYPGEGPITVKTDASLCCDSGFCGTRNAHIGDLLLAAGDEGAADTAIPSAIVAMVEHCPSGSLTYAYRGGETLEPDLPQQIAVTTEITSAGPIPGPLWVTGHVPVERSDGQPCETRNRVTLCSCGQSSNKPFCDGTHREG